MPGPAATPRSSRTRARCSATCASWTPATSCCWTRSARAAGAVQHGAALQDRPRRRAAQADARAGLLSLIGPDAPRSAGAEDLPRTSTPTAGAIGRARAARRHRPRGRRDVRRPHRRGAAALAGRRAEPCSEMAAEIVRVESGRPRFGIDLDRHRDPAGGRPQRARRVLQEGLLRRAGDRRAAVHCGQAEPPPARAAALAPVAAGTVRLGEREVGRVTSSVVVSAPRADRARDGPPRGVPGDTV